MACDDILQLFFDVKYKIVIIEHAYGKGSITYYG